MAAKLTDLERSAHETPRRAAPPVSIVILTANEELNIADCLRSCAWCDDIHVIDSDSTDRTVEIAGAMSAKVHHRPFKSFASQRNWAIDELPCKYPWHFHLDADERFTLELVDEMLAVLGQDGNANDHTAYLVPNKLFFYGKWLRRSASYPAYQARLIRSSRCRFVDFGHGQREETDGSVGRLVQPYLHYPFNKGLSAWLQKHNRYSDAEAAQARQLPRPVISAELFSLDSVARRRALKALSFRFRGRSLMRFLYQYVYKRGFLEGRAGLNYCVLISIYESWIERKLQGPTTDWTTSINEMIETARTHWTAEPAAMDDANSAIREFRKTARTIAPKRPEAGGASFA